jgi:hypothetical protein
VSVIFASSLCFNIISWINFLYWCLTPHPKFIWNKIDLLVSENTVQVEKNWPSKLLTNFIIYNGWVHHITNKGNNKITELRTILQRESQNSEVYKQTKSVNNRKTVKTVMNLTWYRHFWRNGGLNQILKHQTSPFSQTALVKDRETSLFCFYSDSPFGNCSCSLM